MCIWPKCEWDQFYSCERWIFIRQPPSAFETAPIGDVCRLCIEENWKGLAMRPSKSSVSFFLARYQNVQLLTIRKWRTWYCNLSPLTKPSVNPCAEDLSRNLSKFSSIGVILIGKTFKAHMSGLQLYWFLGIKLGWWLGLGLIHFWCLCSKGPIYVPNWLSGCA